MSAGDLLSALDASEDGQATSSFYYLIPNFLFRALVELNPDEAVSDFAYDQLISQWVYRDVNGVLEHLEAAGDQEKESLLKRLNNSG